MNQTQLSKVNLDTKETQMHKVNHFLYKLREEEVNQRVLGNLKNVVNQNES